MSRNIQNLAKIALGSLLLSAALAACAVGPTYNMPKNDLAPFHHKPALASIKGGQVSIDEWWTGFTDPMLTEVVQRALNQNLDLATSFARVQQARAAAAGVGAALLPTADFNASASYERQSLRSPLGEIARTVPGYSRSIRDFNVGPAASWELDVAGQRLCARGHAGSSRVQFSQQVLQIAPAIYRGGGEGAGGGIQRHRQRRI